MLASELEGAQQLLGATGIDVQIEHLKEPFPQTLEAALAWTVRARKPEKPSFCSFFSKKTFIALAVCQAGRSSSLLRLQFIRSFGQYMFFRI